MTSLFLSDHAAPTSPRPRVQARSAQKPAMRATIIAGGAVMTAVTTLAMARGALGLAPERLWSLPLAVALHLATAIPAIPIGAVLFAAPKGTPLHRSLGRIWCALMMATAIATIFIRDVNDGGFSFIHIFTGMVLLGVPLAVVRARRGQIARHVRVLTGLYLGALLIAGAFAFVPGRLMWTLAFG